MTREQVSLLAGAAVIGIFTLAGFLTGGAWMGTVAAMVTFAYLDAK